MRLKNWLAPIVCAVAFACIWIGVTYRPTESKNYVAICDGKSYQTKATGYTFGSYGCIKFYGSDTIQQLCDCNAIALVPEKK